MTGGGGNSRQKNKNFLGGLPDLPMQNLCLLLLFLYNYKTSDLPIHSSPILDLNECQVGGGRGLVKQNSFNYFPAFTIIQGFHYTRNLRIL